MRRLQNPYLGSAKIAVRRPSSISRGIFLPGAFRSLVKTLATYQLDWRSADSDRLRSSEISRGHAHVGDGRLPFWFRSRASPSFFAIAMDAAFVKQLWEMEFDRADDFELNTAIGVRDPVINRIGLLGREELSEGGINGRLYGESLSAALGVHLLRQYGTFSRLPAIHKGGLASGPLKRIIEHINEHLQDELSLVELSRIAKLSPHHFATAFKVSTGISPHRYVIERRINRARDLLLRKEKTISEIAVAVGFSSQSPPNGEFPPEDGSDAAEVSPVPGLNQHMFVLGENAGVAFPTPLVPDLNPSAERLVLRRPDVC